LGLLGSVCPVAGAEAAPEGSIVKLSTTFQRILDPMRSLLGLTLWLAMQPLAPVTHQAYKLYASRMPEGDQRVFADPDIEAMFIDDIIVASRTRFAAVAHDAALFGRPWGFNLADIDTPTFWWHGDADNLVPLAHAEHSVGLMKTVELSIRETESH